MTSSSPLKIKPRLSCPHCWNEFATEEILFISESPDLPDDTKIAGERQRFLPQRFTLAGAALDPHGVPCNKMACPECHLQIPRPWLFLNNFFISIAGAPDSGKSYFLASMVWQLRKTMAKNFASNFTDADTQMNRRIFDSETTLFAGSDNPNRLVRIEKTDDTGNIYNRTVLNGIRTMLAQPFTYTTEPMSNHPLLEKANGTRQVICVYDNAGEHFLPGNDHITVPVTRHMAKSDALLFVFDPTQDVRFRAACTEPVNDPQMEIDSNTETQNRRSLVRQDTVLVNVLSQVRNQKFLSPEEKIKIPLIIVLTKYDAWKQLGKGRFPAGKAPEEYEPWKMSANDLIHYYNMDRVEKHSQILRELLLELIPNFVSTAESAVEKVSYIAVSATGGPPELGENKYFTYYRPVNVKPIWAEVPFFHAQCLTLKSTIPFAKEGKVIL